MGYNNSIIGWMSEFDLQALESICEKYVPVGGNVIELGSLFGKSSVCIAMSVDFSTKIYCIDRFSNNVLLTHDLILESIPISGKLYDSEQLFIENTKKFKNIVIIKGDSPNIDYCFPLIDMFFLDSDHSNPNDWDNLCYFIPLIKEGGIICGHDYSDNFPTIKENVCRLEKIFETTVTLYYNSTMWSIEITNKNVDINYNKYV